jgi:hypothetical protein
MRLVWHVLLELAVVLSLFIAGVGLAARRFVR